MKNVLKIFTIAILTFNVMPLFADTTNWLSKISSAKNPIEAKQAYLQAVEAITKLKEYNSVSQDVKNKAIEDAKKHAGISTMSNEDSANLQTPNNANSDNPQPATITVHGKVVNDNDDPIEVATIMVDGNENKKTFSDKNGEFTLKDVPNNADIVVQYSSYAPIKKPAQTNMTIKYDNITTLNEVVVTPSTNCEDTAKYISKGTYDQNNNCIPSECIEGYSLKDKTCVKDAEESADNKNENETPTDTRTDEEKAQALAEKKQAFDDAKATEQSRENRMLTAATTAATGIGGMQLAQGLAEQRADKSAAQDMAAYIATMRCSYANGKSVKAGPDEIELPGGNDANLMKLRNEYFALASDLKERKTALGMKAGIESEEILDKAATGLYDDESVGITSGTYSSLYRAQMLGSTTDQEQIDADKKTSKNRVIGGGVAAGVGVVGGVVGNSLINGKLGEKIKELKDKRNSTKENNEIINELKNGLRSAGMTNVNKLDLSKFDMTELSDMIHNTDFTKLNLKGKDATKEINTSNSTSLTSSLETLFEQ